jgi:CrcB protein
MTHRDEPPTAPAVPRCRAPLPLLQWAVLSLGAYVGAFARVGLQYVKGGPAAGVAFSVLYAQLLGSFILGAASVYAPALTGGARPHQLLHLFVATGLCGSLTTFSSWAAESNKLALLQLDASSGQIGATYNGGRALEWLLAQLEGVVLPLAALKAGQHAAQACQSRTESAAARSDVGLSSTPPHKEAVTPAAALAAVALLEANPPAWHAVAECSILVLYALATGLVVALTVVSRWPFLAYTGLLGALGTYARFRLAALNKSPPTCGPCSRFPIGTFAANMLGCLVLAIALTASKFLVSYHDVPAQAALYGIVTGFCGCLTTMSTFVLELNTLPRDAAYAYGFASVAGAQLLVATFHESFAATAAARLLAAAATPPPVAPCALFPAACKPPPPRARLRGRRGRDGGRLFRTRVQVRRL